jgi:hypothetical protein
LRLTSTIQGHRAGRIPRQVFFLDRVVGRIVELVGGKAVFYGGNYSFYIREKEARRR